jgi:alpha-D-ribose 1-methylphosphonate 5-triphosphate diphosphatase PhnM
MPTFASASEQRSETDGGSVHMSACVAGMSHLGAVAAGEAALMELLPLACCFV